MTFNFDLGQLARYGSLAVCVCDFNISKCIHDAGEIAMLDNVYRSRFYRTTNIYGYLWQHLIFYSLLDRHFRDLT